MTWSAISESRATSLVIAQEWSAGRREISIAFFSCSLKSGGAVIPRERHP